VADGLGVTDGVEVGDGVKVMVTDTVGVRLGVGVTDGVNATTVGNGVGARVIPPIVIVLVSVLADMPFRSVA